jgi:hypothetical protein
MPLHILISFRGQIDFPKISAIEVNLNGPAPPPAKIPVAPPVKAPPMSAFVPIRINCGGITPHTDALGRVWSSDAYFVGGSTFDSNVDMVSYDIPVPDGVYNVVLHFAEILYVQCRRAACSTALHHV